jgi:hypothetical protein
MYPLPIRRLRDVLKSVLPSETLCSVVEVPNTGLSRLYKLKLTSGRMLSLVFAPNLVVRLLRHEQTLVSSEAALVKFLRGAWKKETAEQDAESAAQILLSVSTASSTYDRKGNEAETDSIMTDLESNMWTSTIIPDIIKHSSSAREMGYQYTVFTLISGVPLSSKSLYLSIPERRHVERQIGRMVKDMANLLSPNGTFGPVMKVCGDPSTVLPHSATGTSTALPSSRGSSSWPLAFMSLVEGVLRDGEDMAVLLPYDVIRSHFLRLEWRLGSVTVPRLVVIDAGDEQNILVERIQDEAGSSPESTSPAQQPKNKITVTGLRDWSQGIFGDPLLCSKFEDPSDDFMDGWKTEDGTCLIEDLEGAKARVLLYKVYRAIIMIVAAYYRPAADSSRRELEGRRKLTGALAELDKIDIPSSSIDSKRSRSGSDSTGDGISKRQKLIDVAVSSA